MLSDVLFSSLLNALVACSPSGRNHPFYRIVYQTNGKYHDGNFKDQLYCFRGPPDRKSSPESKHERYEDGSNVDKMEIFSGHSAS